MFDINTVINAELEKSYERGKFTALGEISDLIAEGGTDSIKIVKNILQYIKQESDKMFGA